MPTLPRDSPVVDVTIVWKARDTVPTTKTCFEFIEEPDRIILADATNVYSVVPLDSVLYYDVVKEADVYAPGA